MKHDPKPKIAVESIQFSHRIKAFHQNLENSIIDVQALISSSSLHEISLSNTPWTWKWVYKRLEARDSRDFGV